MHEKMGEGSSSGVRYGLAGFDAYGNALVFYREARAATLGLRGHVVDPLRRAAESVALNVAEVSPGKPGRRKR